MHMRHYSSINSLHLDGPSPLHDTKHGVRLCAVAGLCLALFEQATRHSLRMFENKD